MKNKKILLALVLLYLAAPLSKTIAMNNLIQKDSYKKTMEKMHKSLEKNSNSMSNNNFNNNQNFNNNNFSNMNIKYNNNNFHNNNFNNNNMINNSNNIILNNKNINSNFNFNNINQNFNNNNNMVNSNPVCSNNMMNSNINNINNNYNMIQNNNNFNNNTNDYKQIIEEIDKKLQEMKDINTYDMEQQLYTFDENYFEELKAKIFYKEIYLDAKLDLLEYKNYKLTPKLYEKIKILKDWISIKSKIMSMRGHLIYYQKLTKQNNDLNNSVYFNKIYELVMYIEAIKALEKSREELKNEYFDLEKRIKNATKASNNELLDINQKICLEKDFNYLKKLYNEMYPIGFEYKCCEEVKKNFIQYYEVSGIDENIYTKEIFERLYNQEHYLQTYKKRFLKEAQEFEELKCYTIKNMIEYYKKEVYKSLDEGKFIKANEQPTLFEILKDYYYNLDQIYKEDRYKEAIPNPHERELFHLFQFKMLYLFVRLNKYIPETMKYIKINETIDNFNKIHKQFLKIPNKQLDPEQDVSIQNYISSTVNIVRSLSPDLKDIVTYLIDRQQITTHIYGLKEGDAALTKNYIEKIEIEKYLEAKKQKENKNNINTQNFNNNNINNNYSMIQNNNNFNNNNSNNNQNFNNNNYNKNNINMNYNNNNNLNKNNNNFINNNDMMFNKNINNNFSFNNINQNFNNNNNMVNNNSVCSNNNMINNNTYNNSIKNINCNNNNNNFNNIINNNINNMNNCFYKK